MRPGQSFEILYGVHPVLEAIKSGKREIREVVISREKRDLIKEIENLTRGKNILLRVSDRSELNRKIGNNEHQGIIAVATSYVYVSQDEILELWAISGKRAFFLILDSVEDPHNLGAISRSAFLSGVHGIFIPERRSAKVTPAVCKASAGAVEHVKIAIVKNLNNLLNELHKYNIHVIALSEDGETFLKDIDARTDIAILIGGEGKGVSFLLKKNCDSRVRIPVSVSGFSYNASVAAGIAMYEVVRQRGIL